jgi:hypothetical protein
VVSITSIRCSSGRKALLSASLSIAFAMAASAAFHPSCLNGPFYGRLYRGRGRAASTPSAGFATPSGFAGTPGIAAFDSLNAGRTAASSRPNVSVSLTKGRVPAVQLLWRPKQGGNVQTGRQREGMERSVPK